MSATPEVPRFANPLRALPSLLGSPAHAAALRERLRPDAEAGDIAALLRLDPLALLGALRAMGAPALATRSAATVDPPTIAGVVRHLGVETAIRLLSSQGAGPVASDALGVAWRESLALAHAARHCAGQAVSFDPDAAYLLGLIANLPDWLAALTGDGRKPTGAEVRNCLRAWRLPHPVANALVGRDAAWNAVLRGAVFLITDPATAGEFLQAADAALAAVGIRADGAVTPAAARTAAPYDASEAFGQAMTELLAPAPSERYRTVVAKLLGAARYHGRYDRAMFAKLHLREGVLTLQARSDGSPQPLLARRVRLTTTDHARLQSASSRREPLLMQLGGDGADCLAAGLAVDELLVVPIHSDPSQPSFLLLDRGLCLAPIDLANDGPFAVMLGQVGSLLYENLLLRRRFARAQRFSLTDPLTHLFNRRMGVIALDQEVARAERTARPLSLLMCDLDYFKRLNDSYGHAEGDRALQAVAEVLRKTVRKGDTICRLGGEEFLVVLPDTHPEDAAVLAARLFTAIHVRGEELSLPLTVSIGLTAFRADDTGERMMQRADHALYASKGQGRNRFSVDVEAGDEQVQPL